MRILHVVIICGFPINYTAVSEKSNTRVDIHPNIITYNIYRSMAKTPLCCSPEVTLPKLDICPSTLILL
jgi:hypothetical protein